MDLEGFCRRIGYSFNDLELLRRALTHRSYSASHNERLEFLGDSVVNCVVALELFGRFPRLAEGELSRLRANIVNQQSLAAVAQQLAFGEQLRLGEGELKSGGARRPSMLADSVEAVIGAVFLDGGFDSARQVVRNLLGGVLDTIDPATSGKDPKTLLQEHLQGRKLALPQYGVVAVRGEAHDQQFQVECVVPELGIRSLGEGASRRSAEQEAARQAYELATRA
jgi:ribonuclease III